MNQSTWDFQAVFKEYYNPLVNFVYSFLHDAEDSKEVVQNVFAKLWENKDSLQFQVSLKAYLYQTAKNSMIDFIRSSKKHKGHSEIGTDLSNMLSDKHAEALDPYIIRAEIIKLLQLVKPKNREIFELSKFEGLTYEEIAEYKQISKRTVEDNISRTMHFLKEKLKNNKEIFS